MLTQRLIQAFYVINIQSLFKDHPEYKWEKDRSRTQIFIQSDLAEDTREQNIMPAVIVDSSGARIEPIGLNADMDDMQVTRLYQIKTAHQMIITSNMQFHVIAESKVEAEDIGFQLLLFANSLRMEAGRMFGVNYVGACTQHPIQAIERQDLHNVYRSTVAFTYQFPVRVVHTPVDPGELLREINTYIDLPPEYLVDTTPDGRVIITLRVTEADVTGEQQLPG